MSAATDAIGAHHFSIPGANCQYCAERGTPLPYNGWCSRYIAANDKAAGDPPGRRGCRYSQQPMPNRMYRIVRIALQSKSRIQNMGNLLLWIRLARTGPMISGLLPFCNHRNFHFLFQMAHCPSFPVSCRDTPQKVPQTEKKPLSSGQRLFSGDPYGTRTHVTAVKGRCLNHLTNGPFW